MIRAKGGGYKTALVVVAIVFILLLSVGLYFPRNLTEPSTERFYRVRDSMIIMSHAVQMYRTEHNGKLPATLAELKSYIHSSPRFVDALRDGAGPTSLDDVMGVECHAGYRTRPCPIRS